MGFLQFADSCLPGLLILGLLCLTPRLILPFRPKLRREIDAELLRPSFVPQLEGLRGLLASLVVVHHGFVRFMVYDRGQGWSEPGSRFFRHCGDVPVLMFFFLTGYLFWGKLLRKPQIELGSYLEARARRLIPVYLTTMVWLFTLVAYLTGFRIRVPISSLVAQVTAWLLFAQTGQPSVNGNYFTGTLIAGTPWSLALEWRFYLLLPMLVWFARRPWRLLYLITFWAILFRLIPVTPNTPLGNFFAQIKFTAGHLAFSFSGGMIVAAISQRWKASQSRTDSAWVSLACIIPLLLIVRSHQDCYFDWRKTLCIAIVFLAIVQGNSFLGLLRSRPMLLLGRSSYALYLCHGLMFGTIDLVLHNHHRAPQSIAATWVVVAVGALAALGASVAIHELVETRFVLHSRHPVRAADSSVTTIAELVTT